MGRNNLTKAEARELITPIVDNEATKAQRKAFMDFIARHEDVRREYESMKKLKTFIGKRCPSAKAPDSLKKFLSTVATAQHQEQSTAPIYDVSSQTSIGKQPKHTKPGQEAYRTNIWFYAAAVVLLLSVIIWVADFWGTPTDQPTYNVDEYAYQHFMNNGGKLVPPTISTASLGVAENRMEQDYDMSITVPKLKNAEFKGVVFDEFVPSYRAPMLEYYLPSEDQYIYIFAFDINKMEQFGQLVRDQEAVKACSKPKDFYIREINDKHVVSWKWNDVWYAAISNHDGNTVASLVEPLEFNP